MPDSVSLGGYIINFIGTECTDGLETWTYSITKDGNPQPEIFSWTLELCFKPLHNVISSSGPGLVVIGQGKPCIPLVGRSIKWEQLSNTDVEGIYSFILDGCYQKAEKQVAVYAGPFCHRALITGPACEEYLIEDVPEYFEEEKEKSLSEEVTEEPENQMNQHLEELVIDEPAQDTPPEFSTRGIKIF